MLSLCQILIHVWSKFMTPRVANNKIQNLVILVFQNEFTLATLLYARVCENWKINFCSRWRLSDKIFFIENNQKWSEDCLDVGTWGPTQIKRTFLKHSSKTLIAENNTKNTLGQMKIARLRSEGNQFPGGCFLSSIKSILIGLVVMKTWNPTNNVWEQSLMFIDISCTVSLQDVGKQGSPQFSLLL